MERQLVKTIIVTFLFIMGYMYVMSTFFPKQQAPSPQVKEEAISPKTQEKIIKETPTELSSVTIGNFVITYSSRGGYIKSISLEKYHTQILPENIGLIKGDQDTLYKVRIEKDRVVFVSAKGQTKEYIVQDNILKIKLSPALASEMIVFSNSLHPKQLENKNQEVFYYQGNLQKLPCIKISEKKLDNAEFAGTNDNYFCLSLLKAKYNLKWTKDADNAYLEVYPPLSEITLYVGPQIEKELKNFGLESIINYGFFHGIGVGLAKLLYFFHSFTKNWGVSIIVLSIITYLILLPFTAKSTKAMKRMQEVQPEIEELRKKYKDNPQKLNQATLELYKKYKVNPIGGCLPLLFQFPVFIALYQVLLKFVEFKKAEFLWIKDLSLPDHTFKLPFPAPVDYLNVLPIFIVIVGLIQQKVNPVSGASEQKTMGLVMVVFMGVIFYNFPAGLSLYWLTQNILTLTYQWRVSRASFSREN